MPVLRGKVGGGRGALGGKALYWDEGEMANHGEWS